mmetsp:Transcript_11395/g.13507  ORF Transcript_11395/g.13507 Transcript_11395/m.13507 type:complete len:89 (+) Transcript_11395:1-267(+)
MRHAEGGGEGEGSHEGSLRAMPRANTSPVTAACNVCLEPYDQEVVAAVIMNCMHVCTCMACATRLKAEQQRCPICRGNIRKVKQLYFS